MGLPDYLEVGDSFTFGNLKQGNLNKLSQIEWLVLDISDKNILVISKYIICKRKYKSEYVSATWEYSEFRKWLNFEFMQNCFSKEERTQIDLSILPNNNLMRESPDDDAQDYIFLLSTYEAERIFSDDKQRIAFLDNSLSDKRNPSKPLSW